MYRLIKPVGNGIDEVEFNLKTDHYPLDFIFIFTCRVSSILILGFLTFRCCLLQIVCDLLENCCLKQVFNDIHYELHVFTLWAMPSMRRGMSYIESSLNPYPFSS
jgi:hypothetical protein